LEKQTGLYKGQPGEDRQNQGKVKKKKNEDRKAEKSWYGKKDQEKTRKKVGHICAPRGGAKKKKQTGLQPSTRPRELGNKSREGWRTHAGATKVKENRKKRGAARRGFGMGGKIIKGKKGKKNNLKKKKRVRGRQSKGGSGYTARKKERLKANMQNRERSRRATDKKKSRSWTRDERDGDGKGRR